MADAVRLDDVVAAGSPWHARLETGERLRIIDLEGHQGVDFLCYNADEPQERYHAPNTIKAAQHILIGAGSRLYSDAARVMMTVVDDSCGGHDTIGGCCSAPSNQMLYGVSAVPGCRENFLHSLDSYGLGRRDIVPNINFFCNVPVSEQGALTEGVFTESRSVPGSFVELRAEIPILALISNCPQVNNPCNRGAPTPIRVIVFRDDS